MGKTMHFATKEGYHKWLSFGHIHGAFKKAAGVTDVFVGGKHHKVKH
jgi:hypothetical protein